MGSIGTLLTPATVAKPTERRGMVATREIAGSVYGAVAGRREPPFNVQSWIATTVWPAMSSEVSSAPLDAARSSRRVTTESRLIAPTPMIVASMVREAT